MYNSILPIEYTQNPDCTNALSLKDPAPTITVEFNKSADFIEVSEWRDFFQTANEACEVTGCAMIATGCVNDYDSDNLFFMDLTPFNILAYNNEI